MEIAEEEEEEQRASKRQSVPDPDGDRPRSPAASSLIADPVALDSQLAASPEHAKFSAESTAELPTFTGLDDRPTSSAKSSDTGSIHPRPELFSSYSAPYGKPKVKLGPRPSLDVSGRPHTASSFRPISAIPAGFKLFGKGIKKAKGSKNLNALAAASAQGAIAGLNLELSADSIPEESLRPEGDTAVPGTSFDAPVDHATMSPPSSKKATVSPEKARLMKAMQLREKKKMLTLQPLTSTPPSVEASPENEAVPAVTSKDNVSKKKTGHQVVDELETNSIHTDSGDLPDTASLLTHADQKSDLTQSDSRPASPVAALSDADQSTKASSLSESTDETVRAKDDGSALGDEDATHETAPKVDMNDQVQPVDEGVPLADDSDSGLQGTAAGASGETRPHRVSENLLSTTASFPGDCEREDALVARSDIEVSRPTALNTNADTNAPHADSQAIFDSRAARNDVSQPVESAMATDADQVSTSNHDSVVTADIVLPPNAASVAPQQAAETTPTATLDEQTTAAQSHEGKVGEMETDSAPAGHPKHKGMIKPIRTDIIEHSRHTSRSEVNFSDDEELMDELQSATMQEAKPMLVAKTPVSATFSTGTIKGRTAPSAPNADTVRTVSNPVRGNLVVPTDVSQSSARSLSSGAAFLHQVTQQQQQGGNLVNKPNIGSSISQRIKALEKLSAASGDAGAPGTRERPSSTFFAVKKREPSRSPSVLERAHSLRRNTPESRPQSEESPSESGRISRRERSMSVTDRLSLFESPSATGISIVHRSASNTRRGRPESISVTAKIIRDPSQSLRAGFEPPKDPSEFSRLELKQSPLLVDHQKAVPEPTRAAAVEPPPERRSTSEERNKPSKSRQSSLSIVKDFIKERRRSVTSNQGDILEAPTAALPSRSPSRSPPVLQNSTFSPRLSLGSRRSSLSQDRQTVTSPPTGESYGDDGKSANGDKRQSRAGRFMRRLSTFSGSRSKNSPPGIAHTVAEESHEPVVPRPATTGSPTIVSYMGDVNVQFPDTLLWKRRNLSLDSQGFLILSALPAHGGRPAQGIKRYHLGEFRPPYIPDVEVQELPDSVVLDFVEGTSIQFACEDRAGQANVLSSEFRDTMAGDSFPNDT